MIRAFTKQWDKEVNMPDELRAALTSFADNEGVSLGYSRDRLFLLSLWRTGDETRWQQSVIESETLTMEEWTEVLEEARHMGIVLASD